MVGHGLDLVAPTVPYWVLQRQGRVSVKAYNQDYNKFDA
jgi:hypothetical protein